MYPVRPNLVESGASLPPYRILDAWRGIACLWVLMFHIAGVEVASHPSLANSILYRMSLQGWLGVQIFFVVSGYCIANAAAASLKKTDGAAGYMKARLRRIYPAYWAAFALSSLLALTALYLIHTHKINSSLMASHAQNTLLNPANLLSNLTLTALLFHGGLLIGPTWTLCYEVAFYIIVWAALLMGQKTSYPEKTMLYFLHVLTLLALLLLIQSPSMMRYPSDLWAEFGFGVLLYHALRYPKEFIPKLIFVIFGLETILLAWFRPLGIGFLSEPARIAFPFAFLLAITLLFLHRWDSQISSITIVKAFSWLGVFSYSLYLTHIFSVGVMHQFMMKISMPAHLQPFMMSVTVVGAVGFAFLFFLVCEKPFLKKRSRVINPELTLPITHTDGDFLEKAD